MTVAGIHLFAVIPAVSGGYPSEGNQDGFPIKNVGNDAAGERFPIHHVGDDNPFSHPRSVWRVSISPSVIPAVYGGYPSERKPR